MSTLHSPVRSRRHDTLALVVVLCLLAIFFSFWFNRFAGLRSGDGEYSGGIAFLSHRLPYRDYYTAGPPLNQLKSALELALFGKTLFVTRFCGALERLVLAALVFMWLRRFFSRMATALATLVTIIVSAGDRTDPLASYNHDAILFAILCGWLASISISASISGRRVLFAAAAGCAAGLSSLTKQTVGLGSAIAVAVLTGLALWQLRGLRRAVFASLAFTAGFGVPVALIAFYLHRLGVLSSALHMLFVAGPAAKASGAHEFITREFSVAAGNPVWLSLAVIALGLSANAIRRNLRDAEDQAPSASASCIAFGVAGALVLGSTGALAFTSWPALEDFGKASVYFAFLGTGVLGVCALVRVWGTKELCERTWQIGLFASVGWSVAFTLSLSWPAFEAMTLPGLALLLASTHDGTRAWGRRFLYLVTAAMVFIQVREKLDLPFAFAHEEEPAIRFATQTSSLSPLRGMRLPPETVRLLNTTTVAFQQAAHHAGDTVFVYPEFGLLYPLADRYPPTLAGSHNIDVVPDGFAREEAARLLAHPPKAILYAKPSEADLLDDERIWRNGHPSGQRDLIAALDQITASYSLMSTFVLKPGDTPIRLYVKLENQGR